MSEGHHLLGSFCVFIVLIKIVNHSYTRRCHERCHESSENFLEMSCFSSIPTIRCILEKEAMQASILKERSQSAKVGQCAGTGVQGAFSQSFTPSSVFAGET